MFTFNSLVTTFHYWTKTFWDEHGDPQVDSLPLANSFVLILTILSGYVTFVLFLGPKMMQNRKAFSLRFPMILYSFLMVCLNLFFFVHFAHNHKVYLRIMFDVQFPKSFVRDESEQQLVFFNYLYFLTKLIDLVDTIFFVLRKKQSQVTGLHVYHHFSVPFFGWMYMRLNGSMNVFILFAFLNTFIHTLMYAYYGLSAVGPAMRRFLWWKQYLTQLQIAQFLVLGFYSIYFVTYQSGYMPFFVYNYLANIALYLILFVKFYIECYHSSSFEKKKP